MLQTWVLMSHLDRLRYLNVSQLRQLLEDEEAVQYFLMISPKFQELQRQKECKWNSNSLLAERNLSYQPRLRNHKLLLAERYQVLGKLLPSVRQKQRDLDSLHRRLSLKAGKHFVEEKAAHFMEESESLWRNFIAGDLLLMDFVESFREARKFYHHHLVQVEKLQELDVKRRRQRRTARLSTDELCSPNAVDAIFSLCPVFMLPTSILPCTRPLVRTSQLPSLQLCGGFPNNPGHLRERRRLQRPMPSQHIDKTGDHAP